MKSFRNPKHLETYEDVVFYLEQALDVAPDGGNPQDRKILDLLLTMQEKLLHLICITRDCQQSLQNKY